MLNQLLVLIENRLSDLNLITELTDEISVHDEYEAEIKKLIKVYNFIEKVIKEQEG